MGKRELLIVLGFIVVGVIVFQFTAPPPKDDEGFSIARFLRNARRGIRGNPGHASWTSTDSVPVAASVREIRIRGINGQIRIAGEDRSDVAMEFTVESTGPDDGEAMALAKQSIIKRDSLEEALVFRADYPTGGRQWGALALRVPKRLGVRIDGGNRLTISDVASLRLSGGSGESSISRVAGEVTGDFGRAPLDIKEVGSVDLTLTNANATISARGSVRLEVRDGRYALQSAAGPVDIDTRRATIQLRDNKGPVRITGAEGRVQIVQPANEVRADLRRTQITAEIAGAAPMSLSTTDERIDFSLTTPADRPDAFPPIELDAVASEGHIQADEFAFAPTSSDRESRLQHSFGPGPRVSLRTLRGDIVIRKNISK